MNTWFEPDRRASLLATALFRTALHRKSFNDMIAALQRIPAHNLWRIRCELY